MKRGPLLPALAAGLVLTACVGPPPTEGPAMSADELLARADSMFGSRSTVETLEAYKLVAVAAQRDEDEALFAEAAAQVASVLALADQPAGAEPWLDQAMAATSPDHPRSWSRVLLARGLVRQALGQRASAYADFQELWNLSLREQLPDRAMQAAWMASGTAPQADRLRWSERCVQIARSTENPRWETSAVEGLAWVQDELELYDEALVTFTTAKNLADTHGTTHEKLRADWAHGRALRRAGHHDQARASMERTLAVARKLQRTVFSPNDAEWVARCHRELAELCVEESDPEGALRHLRTARMRFLQADAEVLAPNVLDEIDARVIEVRALAALAPPGP